MNSKFVKELKERKGGALRSGEPLLRAVPALSAVFSFLRFASYLRSVIPVLALIALSTAGEDESSNYEGNDH